MFTSLELALIILSVEFALLALGLTFYLRRGSDDQRAAAVDSVTTLVGTVERTENAYQIDDPYAFVATDRVQVFRITALGIGATEHARVMLQTTYGRVMD